VMTYAPGVVPPLPGLFGAVVDPPPQPTIAPVNMATAITANTAGIRRRRFGRRKKKRDAKAMLPPTVRLRGRRFSSAATVLAVLFTVSVAMTAVVPVMDGGVVTEQVGSSVAPVGVAVTAQLSATAPINPPLGVTVIVDVTGVPGVTFVIATPLSAKLGVAVTLFTVTETLVPCVMAPDVPFTLTVYVPAPVSAAVVTVSVAVTAFVPVIAGGAETEQVGGSFNVLAATEHVRATAPVNPLLGVTVMVEVPVVPGVEIVMDVLVSAKPGTAGTLTTTGILTLAVRLPAVPRMLSM